MSAYAYSIRRANNIATVQSWFIWIVETVHILTWIVVAVLYRVGKTGKDLWGWACSPVAEKIQPTFEGVVNFNKICSRGVSSSQFPLSLDSELIFYVDKPMAPCVSECFSSNIDCDCLLPHVAEEKGQEVDQGRWAMKCYGFSFFACCSSGFESTNCLVLCIILVEQVACESRTVLPGFWPKLSAKVLKWSLGRHGALNCSWLVEWEDSTRSRSSREPFNIALLFGLRGEVRKEDAYDGITKSSIQLVGPNGISSLLLLFILSSGFVFLSRLLLAAPHFSG